MRKGEREKGRKGEREMKVIKENKKMGESEMAKKIIFQFSFYHSFTLTPIHPFSPSLFLIVLFLTITVSGATLEEYRGKIQSARNLTDELIYDNGENLSDSAKTKLDKLRGKLSTSEKVEWRGSVVETDNRWLAEKLDEFEEESDTAERKLILQSVKERLLAIEQKISELENPTASNRSKDEDKRKLSEILNREEFKKPAEKEESFFQKVKRKLSEWFGKTAPDAPQMPQGVSNGFGAIAQVLVYVLYGLIFAAIAFVIYKFLPFVTNKFKNREKREKEERIILGERIAANESADTLFSEAENLAREGNMRGAIRKGYIALLCELSDRKIIGLAQHKTNRDYLRDVRKKEELHQNMNGLTQNYERHWYGFEEADENDWEEFRQGYKKAVQ